MSETEGQEEPTMEEILASIRKIISEDDVPEDKDEEKGEEEADVVEKPEDPVEEPAQEEDMDLEDDDDEVLELTEDMAEEEVVEEPEPELEADPEPEPELEPEVEMAIDDVDPASGEDELMSDETAQYSMDQFNVLSDLLTTGYQGAGNTLEDLVREMLKPMLKEWLDRNLPSIVERMIAKEIARLARTKKP